ncbi:helix-turn-helix domain-containing protein [Peptococcus simiae]|uniref:Helix-turn-helix domain-containing protein n=1 Tax=Peptococcus simiae TaxID=1643805 RepID=A0ABW9H229_9FIRM
MMRLMTLLYRHDGEWLKYTELAREIGISRRTVKTYTENLEKLFADYSKFEHTGSMIRGSFNSNFGLLTMQKTFLYNSLIVQIFYKSFFRPNMDKLDLSMDLNCSVSSIFRNVQLFNEKFAVGYKLRYSYADLQFTGDERDIQKFYVNFFIEVLPNPLSWPFEDFFAEEDAKVLTRLAGKYINKRPFHPAHFKYVKMALAVALIRLQQGYAIPINEHNPLFIPRLEKVLADPEAQAILDKYAVDPDSSRLDFLYQLLAYFLSEEFMFFLADPAVPYKNDENYSAQYNYYLEKVQYLQGKYNICVSDTETFYNALYTYFRFKVSNIDASDFFVNHSDYFLNYVKLLNVDFHNELTTLVEDYLTKFHPHVKDRTKDLAYTVYSLWPDFLPQLMKNIPPYRALVVSHYDHYYAKTLANLLNCLNPRVLQAEVYKGEEIDLEALHHTGHEVLITDFVFPNPPEGKLLFNFEQLPSVPNLHKLLLTITNHMTQRTIESTPEEFDDYYHKMIIDKKIRG